jgi:hypothetical protein
MLPLHQGRVFSAEAVRLELTTVSPAPVFKTGSSSGRMTSFTSCGSRNRTRVTTGQSRLPVPTQASPHQFSISWGGRSRTCGHVVQSHVFLPTETTPQSQEGRAGLEPARWCLTGTRSATELPTQIQSALRESNPPRQVGSLEPLPLGQGHVVLKRKVRELNPSRRSSRSAAFEAAAIANWIALPFS